MKDLLSGAELIEVRLGLSKIAHPSLPSQYYCTLVFKQDNEGEIEILHEVYSIATEQMMQKFGPLTAIGKRIKACTKTLLGDEYIVKYEFEDGYYLNTWS